MKPIWKWIIGVFIFIVVALIGASWYFSHNWKPIIEEKLQEFIADATDSLYTLTYDELDISLALGNVTLTNVALKADTQVYARMESAEQAPDDLYDVEVRELKVRRFGIMSILRKKELNINAIVLADPTVHLTNKYHAYNDTVSTEDKSDKSLYERIQGTLSAIDIDQLVIENAAFTYSKVEENGQSSGLTVEGVQLHIADILIDEDSQADTARFYYTKRMELVVPGFEYELPDGFYKAKFDVLKVNTEEQTVLLTNVDYKPAVGRDAFYKKQGKNVTRADLHFDTLYVEKLDFTKLIEEQQTVARAVHIKQGYAKLYGDKRYPSTRSNHIGHAPHQKLMELENLVRVDSVFVENVDVVYGEMSAKYERVGEISFNGATGVMTNVTNDSVALSQDKFARADLRARIMGKGNLHAMFAFDMLGKNGEHSYKGSLGRMDATAFNRILYPLLNVEIRSGNIRDIHFDISSTDYRSRGDFRFNYDNLKVDIKGDPDKPRKKSSLKVVSWLVNQIIINDSNPDANEKYHVGTVDYERDPSHTFFKYMWQSLLDGIKQTAGISREREKKWIERTETAQQTMDRTKRTMKRTKETSEKTKGFFKGLFKKKEK